MSNSVKNTKLAHKCHVRIRNKRAVLQLQSPLSIASVGQLKDELSKKLMSKVVDKLVIDGDEINSADTASLQLLCSLVGWVNAQDIEFSWSAVSEAITETAARLGLTEHLQLDNAAV